MKRHIVAMVVLMIFAALVLGTAVMPGCTETGSASGSSTGYKIVLNEAMSSNSLYAQAANGGYYDWIELHNLSDTAIDLTGCYLGDSESESMRYKIRDLTIEAGGYKLIYLSGLDQVDESGMVHANFKLSSMGEMVLLSDPDGYIISRIDIPGSEQNISYGVDEAGGTGSFVWFSEPTPGRANSANNAASVSNLVYLNNGVVINEYCPNNTFSIYDEDGDYKDWVELYNPTSQDADMTGYALTDDKEKPSKWVFPDGLTIPAGEYLVVFCSGKDRAVSGSILHTSFSLSAEDAYLGLYTSQGKLADSVELMDLAQNVSCGYMPSERTLKLFSCPTPGRANSTSSYELTASVTANLNKGVLISETLAVSTSAKTYNRDYIELYNSTSEAVLLSGYSIAKDPGEPLFTFPEGASIASGGYLLVYCDGTENVSKMSNLQAAFKLNAGGDSLYLMDAQKNVIDYLETGKQVYGVTSGRLGGDVGARYFFASPTPGAVNDAKTYKGYAAAPTVSLGGGVYEEAVEVTVNVPDGCTLYYTTNGSKPTTSSRSASEDITLTFKSNTVLRAMCAKGGSLSSDVITESYLIGVSHTLPIVSLSSDYNGLFSHGSGIMVDGPGWTAPRPHYGANYWNGVEREASIEFFDESGIKAVEFNAAIRCFGQYARGEPQKGLRLMLREENGCNEVTYPFFKDCEVTTFSSLLLRPSGQDWNRAKIRDEIVPNIIRGRMEIDYQEARACVLYIDGEYWGIYYIREKLNEEYIESHHADEGYEKGKIDLIKSQMIVQAGSLADYKAITNYARENDLSKPECYEYMCSKIDMDSLINFWIVETYFCNSDSGNIRCYRDQNNGKWRWMLYDFDWGMTGSTWKSNFIDRHLLDPNGHGATDNMSNIIIRKLLKNDEFRDKFISAYCYHINTTFSSERTLAILDEMAGLLEDEIPNQSKRWGAPTMVIWKSNVNLLKTFFKEKPELAVKQLKSSFNLSDAQMQRYLSENK